MPPVTASLLTALPSAAQARLRAVGDAHRTEFGTCRRYQAAFDEHVGFFDTLIARGASHAVIGKLLAEVGIARATVRRCRWAPSPGPSAAPASAPQPPGRAPWQS